MRNLQDELTIPERLSAPTPKLFRVLRNIGVVLAAVSGALISAKTQGVTLPEAIDVFANYATTVAGIVTSLVSQLTVDVEAFKKQNALK